MKIKQQLLNSVAYDKRLLEQKIKGIEQFPLELISQAFPDGSWEMHYDGPAFALPYKFEYVPLIKEFMELQFPNVEFIREQQIVWEQYSQAGYHISYRWDNDLELEFRLDSTKTGTTCILNKIGETQKVVPIYEVVCSEAAASEFSMEPQ